MNIQTLLISLASIIVVFYALFRAANLNKKIPGGHVKESWRLLYYMIGLIAIGYLTMPLLPRLPDPSKDLVVAILGLAGAFFMVRVVNLIHTIVKEVGL